MEMGNLIPGAALPQTLGRNDLVHALNLFKTRTLDSSLGAVGIEGKNVKLSDVGGTGVGGGGGVISWCPVQILSLWLHSF